MSDFTYFPYLRTGLASAVTTPDDGQAAGHVELTAVAKVNGAVAEDVPLRLAGPGEIRGLDVRAVIRNRSRAGGDRSAAAPVRDGRDPPAGPAVDVHSARRRGHSAASVDVPDRHRVRRRRAGCGHVAAAAAADGGTAAGVPA